MIGEVGGESRLLCSGSAMLSPDAIGSLLAELDNCAGVDGADKSEPEPTSRGDSPGPRGRSGGRGRMAGLLVFHRLGEPGELGDASAGGLGERGEETASGCSD